MFALGVDTTHLYFIPNGTIFPFNPLTGLMAKNESLQIKSLVSFMNGAGFNSTVNLKVSPTQFPMAPETGTTL